MWLPIHIELLELNKSDLYKLYIDSHYSDNVYHPENARERFHRRRDEVGQESSLEFQDQTNLSSVTFDHEDARNTERSNDAYKNSDSRIKCVVIKKKTSIEEISSKTFSNSKQIGKNEMRLGMSQKENV